LSVIRSFYSIASVMFNGFRAILPAITLGRSSLRVANVTENEPRPDRMCGRKISRFLDRSGHG
jgi:hypothetical protein